MLSAIVLLTTERDKTNKVAQTLADTDGVSEVYSVAGRYDLAVIVRVKDNDALAEVVTEHPSQLRRIRIPPATPYEGSARDAVADTGDPARARRRRR